MPQVGVWLTLLLVWTIGIPAIVVGLLLLVTLRRAPARALCDRRVRVPVLGHRSVGRVSCQGASAGARLGIRAHASMR